VKCVVRETSQKTFNVVFVQFENEAAVRIMDHNRRGEFEKREMEPGRTFYVRAPSVSAVRRALHRAPGGARIVGRHDRDTIVCTHTMDGHSLARHWPVIVSRLVKAGLALVPRPGSELGAARGSKNPSGD